MMNMYVFYLNYIIEKYFYSFQQSFIKQIKFDFTNSSTEINYFEK